MFIGALCSDPQISNFAFPCLSFCLFPSTRTDTAPVVFFFPSPSPTIQAGSPVSLSMDLGGQQNRWDELIINEHGERRLATQPRSSRALASVAFDPQLCIPSHLDCCMHRLFRERNFRHDDSATGQREHISPGLYRILKPALRLATCFLEQTPCMKKYWTTLMFGRRKIDEVTSMVSGAPALRIRELRNHPERDNKRAKSALRAMSGRAVFCFVLGQIDAGGDPDCWAAHTDPDPDVFRDSWDGPDFNPWTIPIDIEISRRLYETAKKLENAMPVNERTGLRFNFFFATTICHEVAHAIERSSLLRHFHFQDCDLNTVIDHQETYLLANDKTEAGEVFESMFMGGTVRPRGDRCDFSLPLERMPFPQQAENPTFCEDIPDWFVNLVQLPVFWKTIEGGEYPEFLLDGVDHEGNTINSIGQALEAIENWRAEHVDPERW
jgi:hypothetical protein